MLLGNIDHFGIVLPHYQNSERIYHNTQHIFDLLNRHDSFKHLLFKNLKYYDKEFVDRAIHLAILYHDVVYDINASSPKNEIDSAEFFNKIVDFERTELEDELVSLATNLILVTGVHFTNKWKDTYIKYSDLNSDDIMIINYFMELDILGFAKNYNEFKEDNIKIDFEYINQRIDSVISAMSVYHKRLTFLKMAHDNIKFNFFDEYDYIKNRTEIAKLNISKIILEYEYAIKYSTRLLS